MSDEPGMPTDGPAAGPAARPPVMPPVISSVPSDVTSAAVAPLRRRPAAYVAVVIGLLGLVGGAIFFVRSVGTSADGAKTPEAAVQKLFDALSNEDALGVLESFAPSERDVLTGRLRAITRELGRLGILREDVDLGDISGVDLTFTGLRYQTQSLGTGFSYVKLTAGTSTYAVNPAESPVGDFLRGFLPRSAAKAVRGSDDLANDKIAFATVQQDGSWYVSIWYTAAEQARRDAGAALPTFGEGIVARGTETPEAAVEALLRAAALVNVRRMIELTPPDEAAALHDYAPLFIDQAEAAAVEARRAFSFTIRSVDLSHSGSGDENVVKIDDMSFRLSVPEFGISVDYDGECATLDLGEVFGPSAGPQRICDKGLLPSLELPGLARQPDLGFVVVRRDGLWYVSPTRTVLDAITATLKPLRPADLEAFEQLFGDLGFGAPGFNFELPGGFPTPST
jgi:hypothetical protein